ncbi:hypothetical protein [Dictyobacter aurantiacus]|uniref:Uncharacterized protein n=1 Tax=Dictyobacter aurantiacus TaxID=1936993 RepID=A0A401ZGI8_9CHLR|nr:hypothetical protein [Dictyobacter aurantiacus]GCE05798.1 hypothetical protein KDAU_31270 [Dictyobacter aurantiacus]
MINRTDFTDHEWKQLEDLPIIIGSGIVAISRSGAIGKIKEAMSLISGPREAAKQFPANQLIQELLSSEGTKSSQEEDHEKVLFVNDPAQVTGFLMERCREVVTILDSKVSVEEANDYKRWIVASAEHVANTSKSGGFLGFGGKHIDDREAQFLQTLRETLGISA